MPQSRNVTHYAVEEGQIGFENSLYPNILSWLPPVMMEVFNLCARGQESI